MLSQGPHLVSRETSACNQAKSRFAGGEYNIDIQFKAIVHPKMEIVVIY